ncbi:MAG: FG-GAP-like repeat-containing protein [Pyrinomonadaceae bacterium]
MNLPKIYFKRFIIFSLVFLTTAISGLSIKAQTSGVDLSFNAIPSKEPAVSINFTLQSDGKILVFGGVLIIDGAAKNQIARLNSDGSLDNSFDCAACNFYIGSAVIQPDGKIVVGGSAYSSLPDSSVARVARLNSDGSLDNTFVSPFGEPVAYSTSSAIVEAVQPDGKVLISTINSYQGSSYFGLRRLDAKGSFDSSFTTIDFGGGRALGFYDKVFVLSDGKILVGGTYSSSGSSSGFIRRYNSDGTLETTFEQPSFSGTAGGFGGGNSVNDFDVQADGKILVGGNFNKVNGVDRVNIVRLLSAGNVDLSFEAANAYVTSEAVSEVEILSSGKILVSTGSGLFQGSGNRFLRFNADGSMDSSFVPSSNFTQIGHWEIDAAGRIVVSGGFNENGVIVYKIVRLNPNGDTDNSFAANIGIPGSIAVLAIQADGKIVVFGSFTRINGVRRANLARLNSDGTIDPTFNPGSGFSGGTEIRKILVQPDGKILVIGYFTDYNGTPRREIARLNSDGSLDASFNPTVNSSVYAIALQADGKILIGGSFGSVNGATRTGIARLNADGSLDVSFNPLFGSPTIYDIAVQADGKIIVGGFFNGVNGFSRTNLVRLNTDGTLDSSFNAGSISTVKRIESQGAGNYFILTAFGKIIRLRGDGSTDASFQSQSEANINDILAQPDGSIIIVGSFSAINNIPRSNIARLQPNGRVDLAFFPIGANGAVKTIARQADGRILIGGDFTTIAGVVRVGIARLDVSPYHLITRFDFDGDGRADISVFRPSNGYWFELYSQNNSFHAFPFGQAGDLIAPADYDGDGRSDLAVFRGTVPGAGNFAYFYIFNSADNSFRPEQFGATGDVPMAGDWDGDGKADLAVYRAAATVGGQSYFFYRPSSQPGVNFRTIAWGGAGDKPLAGDFDGDGKQDAAIFHPASAQWYIIRSSNSSIINTTFGAPTDIPVPADYDGDGITNIAVFRPSTGYWFTSQNPATNYGAIQFGASGDLPVPADYDGDGKADVAVYRPSTGAWYLLRSTQGFTGVAFGDVNDKPIPNAYIR